MRRPNKYSHAFVLSNYSNNGLIDPSSPFQEEPPFPIPIRSPYKPIARPARLTLTNLPSLTESTSVPRTNDKIQGDDTTGRAAELRDEAKIRRSNSVVTQIYAPDGGATTPVPEIGNSLATEALPEERTLITNTTIKQRPGSQAATIHRHDESTVTQIYSPIEQPTFSPPKTPPPCTASMRRQNLEATASSHETAAVKGLSRRYKHEVPRSWVSFGGQGSRYWKPLPLEPSLVPYKPPGPGDLDAHSCELEQEKVSSKRNSNESASTTSTSSALSHQNDTPCTSPSTTSPSLASSLISRKEPASMLSPRSRIPVLASRRSSIDQDKKMGHRRISSQLSEDFRVIDDLTMESLMRSPPRDSGDEVDGFYSEGKKHSKGGQEEDHDDDGGENWLYPPTGPEIFCTPPKSVSLLSSRPTIPTRKRSSSPRQHRPQTSRLPSQASFSGFSDSAPARNDAIADDRQTSDSEDSAAPPPISFGRRPERPVSMSIDKRGPSFRDFMSGRKDRSAAMSGGGGGGGGNERPSTSASNNSDGKRSRTSSFTAFISGLSRRASTSESVVAAKRAEELKQRAEVRKSSEEDKKEKEKEKKHVPAENTTPTKGSDQPRESEKKRKGKEMEKHNVPAKDSIPTKTSNQPHSNPLPPAPPARKSSLEKNQKSRPTSTKTEQKTARHRESWGCGDKPLVTVLDYTAENIATSPPIPPRWQIDAETTKPIIPPIDDTKATTNANTNDNNGKAEKKHDQPQQQQPQPSSSLLLSATASAKSIKAWRINRFNAKRNLGMGNKKQHHHPPHHHHHHHQWVK